MSIINFMQIDSDEALAVLREQVAAEVERNRINQELLDETRRQRVAEQARLKIWFDIAEKVAGIPGALNSLQLSFCGLDESLSNIDRRLGRIDEIMLINIAGKGNGWKSRIGELKTELEDEHNQALLLQYQRNLQKLQEQAALFGLNVPLDITNQIEITQDSIARIEAKIK